MSFIFSSFMFMVFKNNYLTDIWIHEIGCEKSLNWSGKCYDLGKNTLCLFPGLFPKSRGSTWDICRAYSESSRTAACKTIHGLWINGTSLEPQRFIDPSVKRLVMKYPRSLRGFQNWQGVGAKTDNLFHTAMGITKWFLSDFFFFNAEVGFSWAFDWRWDFFLRKNDKYHGTHNEIATVGNTLFLSYFNIYEERESFLLFFTWTSLGYRCSFVVSFSQGNEIFIFVGDITGQVFYCILSSQLCSMKDNRSPPAVFDAIQHLGKLITSSFLILQIKEKPLLVSGAKDSPLHNSWEAPLNYEEEGLTTFLRGADRVQKVSVSGLGLDGEQHEWWIFSPQRGTERE